MEDNMACKLSILFSRGELRYQTFDDISRMNINWFNICNERLTTENQIPMTFKVLKNKRGKYNVLNEYTNSYMSLKSFIKKFKKYNNNWTIYRPI